MLSAVTSYTPHRLLTYGFSKGKDLHVRQRSYRVVRVKFWLEWTEEILRDSFEVKRIRKRGVVTGEGSGGAEEVGFVICF